MVRVYKNMGVAAFISASRPTRHRQARAACPTNGTRPLEIYDKTKGREKFRNRERPSHGHSDTAVISDLWAGCKCGLRYGLSRRW